MFRPYPHNRLALIGAVCAALAVAPAAALADPGPGEVTGALSGGSLTLVTPTLAPFAFTLTGLTQNVQTLVGGWSVNDARGTHEGYSVVVSASVPKVENSSAKAGHGADINLLPATAAADTNNPAPSGDTPVAAVTPLSLLTVGGVLIENAAATTGEGQWNFAADQPSEGFGGALTITIPGDAYVGAFTSTLTYTTADAFPA